MKYKLILGIFALMLLCAVSIAISTSNLGNIISAGNVTVQGDYLVVDGYLNSTTLDTGQGANELYDMNQNVLTSSYVTFANVSATYFNGNSTWSHQSYPAACSAGYAVTTIGDSNTCTEFLLTTGGTLAGNLAMGNYNITGVNELSSTLVDTTNLEVDNLESNMDGTGYNITMANTIVPTNGKVCLNDATCTAYVYYNGTDTVIVSP